eukprot:UN09030
MSNSNKYNKNRCQTRNNRNNNKYNKNRFQSYNQNKRHKKQTPLCGVCKINESKYKCPNCRVTRYCSVACYKKHKENKQQCIKPIKTLKYDKNEPVSVTGYTVSQKQFQLLENDDKLKEKLMNRRLRQIIESIDDSRRPQNRLETLMKNDKDFAEFVDCMLKVIGFRPNVENKDKNEQNALDKYYEENVDLDAMNDNDKF